MKASAHPLQICSSQWSEHEQEEICSIARDILPEILLIVIPPGLNASKGGDVVVDFLKEKVRELGIPEQTV